MDKKKNGRCIVHIGMHKTGSSSIQNTLHNHLEDQDFFYVKLDSCNHSSNITSLFSDFPEKNHQYRKLGFKKDQIIRKNKIIESSLIKSFKSKKANNYILSGEDIISLSLSELEKFKNFLDNYFQEILIVGYVRSPISYMESAFQQQIKGGFGRFDILAKYPSYREKFEKFDLIFGREHVYLWKFDPKEFTGKDVVLDFCYRLGIQIDFDKVNRTNEGMSREALSLLYTYRKLGSGYGVGFNAISENMKIINNLLKIGDTKLKFSISLFAPSLNKNKKDMEWIEKRIGKSLYEHREEDQECIMSESDLLKVEKTSIEELKKMIGKDNLPIGIVGDTSEEIAILVHSLRMKLTRELKIENKEILKNINYSNNETISKKLLLILCIDNKYNKKDFGKYSVNIKNNLIRNLSKLGKSNFSTSMSLFNLSYEKYVEKMNLLCKKNNDNLYVENDTFDELVNIVGRSHLPEVLHVNKIENIAKILQIYKERIYQKVIELHRSKEDKLNKKTFSIYGNCQSGALLETLMKNKEFTQQYKDLKNKFVQNITKEEVSVTENIFANADVLIHQTISDTYHIQGLSTSKLMENRKKGSRSISFPSLYFNGYFPHLDTFNKVPSILNLVHDYIIMYSYAIGLNEQQILDLIANEKLYSKELSLQLCDDSIDSLRIREKNLDIRVSEYIEKNYRNIKLFNQFNHPIGRVLDHIANQVFNKLEIGSIEESSDTKTSLDAIKTPIYISTYKNLDLTFKENFNKYSTLKGELDQQEVLNHFLQTYSTFDRKELVDTVNQKKPFIVSMFRELQIL